MHDDDDEIPGLVVEPGGDAGPTEMEKRFGIRHYRVRDERAGSPHPPHRHQHSFPDSERTEWRKEFYERLDQLRGSSLRHVARPLEVGKVPGRQRIYILSDYYEHTLEIGDNGLANDPKKSPPGSYSLRSWQGSTHCTKLTCHMGPFPRKSGVDERTDTAWICARPGAAWTLDPRGLRGHGCPTLCRSRRSWQILGSQRKGRPVRAGPNRHRIGRRRPPAARTKMMNSRISNVC